MTWIYQGKELTDEAIPDKAFGFVYLITHKPTGRKYIGRKQLQKVHTRQKAGKKIKTKVDSDWRDYWSSSPALQEEIAANGTADYEREVLMFTHMKGLLTYLEERLQYSLGVLESDQWMNGNIRSRIQGKHIKDRVNTDEIESIINRLK